MRLWIQEGNLELPAPPQSDAYYLMLWAQYDAAESTGGMRGSTGLPSGPGAAESVSSRNPCPADLPCGRTAESTAP